MIGVNETLCEHLARDLNVFGMIIGTGFNRKESDQDPSAHAEMLVLSAASRTAADWRLSGHALVVTLEPCPMCAMAAVWARVDRIVSKWDEEAIAALGSAERVDVTMELVQAMETDERQLKAVRQIGKQPPIPLEELEKAGHDDH